MKIIVIASCNFMGRPAVPNEQIEARNHAEEVAAEYLVSIGKATKVLEVSAQEEVVEDETAEEEEE